MLNSIIDVILASSYWTLVDIFLYFADNTCDLYVDYFYVEVNLKIYIKQC